jgi:spore germination protein YaaH
VRAHSAKLSRLLAGPGRLTRRLGRRLPGRRGRGERPRLTLVPGTGPAGEDPAAGPSAEPVLLPRRPGGQHGRRVPGRGWLAVIPAGIVAVILTVHAFSGPGRAGPAARPAAGASNGARPAGTAAASPPAAAAPARPGGRIPVVVASLPYWSIGQVTGSVLANRSDVNEASPWIYRVSAGGQVRLDPGISQAALSASLGQLRARGLPLVPTLANVDAQGGFSYPAVGRILHDQALTARHVADIVALVNAQHYAGIDIDYEDLHAADRQAFTGFITALATALHASGKILSVALFAKASDAGYAPRNLAQDYAAIGRVADQVRLMGYDYHWATSPPGPVAPVGWLTAVLTYARTQIPARKIILGVPAYGYDWTGGQGTGITWQQAAARARRAGVRVRYSAASQAPWFRYTDAAGRPHTVWFEDARSSRAKFELARTAGIGGVYLWLYGNADPGTWPALRQALPAGSQPSGPSARSTS